VFSVLVSTPAAAWTFEPDVVNPCPSPIAPLEPAKRDPPAAEVANWLNVTASVPTVVMLAARTQLELTLVAPAVTKV